MISKASHSPQEQGSAGCRGSPGLGRHLLATRAHCG